MTPEDMHFIETLFRSLETQMNQQFDKMRTEFAGRFDAVDARLDHANARLEKIGGLVNGGSRALTKMIEWSEKADTSVADLLRRQEDMDARLRKLESKSGKTDEPA